MKNHKFKLLQYFSLTSLSAFVAAVFFLGYFYRQQSMKDLISLGEKQNVALTKSFSNSLWLEFKAFLEESEQLSDEQLRDRPQLAALNEAVKLQTDGLSVVKIKIFNKKGKVIFSTDEKQIGLGQQDSAGFKKSRTRSHFTIALQSESSALQ
jgi:hypothetical protein